MNRRAFYRASFGLSVAVFSVVAAPSAGEEKETARTDDGVVAEGPFAGTPKEQLEAWKKKYAYQSLRGRLAYENKAIAPAKLSPAVAERLKSVDEFYDRAIFQDRRAISLAMLHGENVDKFVKSPGFGFSRMQSPGPAYLQEERKIESIPLATASPLSEGDASLGLTTKLVDEAAAASPATNPWRMPTTAEADRLHNNVKHSFAGALGFGYVKSVDQVAGFQPHGMTEAPSAPVDTARVSYEKRQEVEYHDVDKRWKTVRLELVSLLKHETPRVYVSENLPRMDELSSVKTRELNAFETAALKKLVDGEDLDTASTPNRIEMMGSLRATKECRECHQVPHGTLLGAFSYELRRDPPIKVEAPKGRAVQ